MDAQAAPVLDALGALGITYQLHEHPPVFTVEQAVEHWSGIDAAHCKNLFLRNRKGTRHYLVVIEHRKNVDLQRLAGAVGDDRLSFGSPDRLARLLQLTPGAVSPFGLLNDPARQVQVVIDGSLREAPAIAFHPNVNTATVVIAFTDFERFLVFTGHTPRYVGI